MPLPCKQIHIRLDDEMTLCDLCPYNSCPLEDGEMDEQMSDRSLRKW